MTKPKHMKYANQYKSTTERASLVDSPVFVTGVARSGTTLLGNLIGSLQGMEYDFEPPILAHLPVLARKGLIEEEVAVSLLKTVLGEAFYEKVVGRSVNLRPTDDSCFLNMKLYSDLWGRWNEESTRNEVNQQAADGVLRPAMKVPDSTPHLRTLLRWFPEGHVITITRHGFDVASSYTRKGWCADKALKKLIRMMPMREVSPSEERLVPFWLPQEWEDEYLRWNACTRALFTWRYLVEEGERQKEAMTEDEQSRHIAIRYEALVQDPIRTVKEVSDFLGTAFTPKTDELIGKIDAGRARRVKADSNPYDPEEVERAKRVMRKLGYEQDAIAPTTQ